VVLLKQVIDRMHTVVVEFCAAGTRMELCLVPACDMIGSEEVNIGQDRHIVALLNFHTSHHFEMGWTHPNYIAEKLKVSFKDATNLCALFTALAAKDVEGYLAKLPMCPFDKDSIADDEVPPPTE